MIEIGDSGEVDDNHNAEMEKRADGADASVLFFSSCCANLLAVSAQNS